MRPLSQNQEKKKQEEECNLKSSTTSNTLKNLRNNAFFLPNLMAFIIISVSFCGSVSGSMHCQAQFYVILKQ